MMLSPKLQQLLRDAVMHHQAGRLERAELIYRQLITAASPSARVFDLLGQLEMQQGRPAEAARQFSRAAQLDPKEAGVGVRLGLAMAAEGKLAEAEATLRRLAHAFPRSAEAWNACGYVLKSQGRLAEAVAFHEQALKLAPKLIEGWYHLGHAFAMGGRNAQALPCFERALKLNPKYSLARFGRAQALHKSYRLAEAIADYDAVLKAEPNRHEVRSCRLFALQNMENLSREQLFDEHRAYGVAVGRAPAGFTEHDFEPERRLRLAILSPDLREHSCTYFLEPLLAHIDPTEFEICLYHDHTTEDAVSARLRSHAALWRNFAGQSPAVVERVIRADKPDILIDLAGHIGSTIRLPVLARRLAPVQVTYLGYPDTTGVAAMDYRFTDAIADPVGGSERYHTEQLVRFAPTAWSYLPPNEAPAVAPLPGINGGRVTYGCFNNPTKFTDGLFVVWARLLERVPAARLLLKGRDFEDASVREQLLARMRAQGIPLERLELLPRTADTAGHLALYAQVDIALDTFPYAGTTTTCEALWMGRPVVTLSGSRHASRVGASLLTALGRPEWIAQNPESYVEIAARLASRLSDVANSSSQLRDQMRASVLCDHEAHAQAFAAGLRGCWKQRGDQAAREGKNLPVVTMA